MSFIVKNRPIQSITAYWPSVRESKLMVYHVGQRGVDQILFEKISDFCYFVIIDKDGCVIEHVQQSFVASIKYIPIVRTDA